MSTAQITVRGEDLTDSGYAWWRLAASMALGTIGGVGMWSSVVVLPLIQTEFGIDAPTARCPIPR